MTKIVSTFSKLNVIPEPPQPAGRICAEKECSTLLSRYNGTDFCSLHRGWSRVGHGSPAHRVGERFRDSSPEERAAMRPYLL